VLLKPPEAARIADFPCSAGIAGSSAVYSGRSAHRSARPGAGKFVSVSNPLSVSNRAELIDGYVAGVPVRELATRFNVHRGTVREIARQAGLAAHQPELADAIRQDAARLYADGLTLAQFAMQLGISDEAVRSAVLACSGTIRPGGCRRVQV
jgi:hypothetical protein